MIVYHEEIKVETNGEVDIINITDDLQNIVKISKINNSIIQKMGI